MSQGGPKALLVLSSPLFTPHRAQIAELAIRFQLPAMFIFRTYVEAGGLMSYGVDVALMYQRAASYVFSGARSRLVCLSIRPINSISL
jgi:putative ABC transport system substrate-binding protein